MACCRILMDHSKLTVQLDQMLKENEREKDNKSERESKKRGMAKQIFHAFSIVTQLHRLAKCKIPLCFGGNWQIQWKKPINQEQE